MRRTQFILQLAAGLLLAVAFPLAKTQGLWLLFFCVPLILLAIATGLGEIDDLRNASMFLGVLHGAFWFSVLLFTPGWNVNSEGWYPLAGPAEDWGFTFLLVASFLFMIFLRNLVYKRGSRGKALGGLVAHIILTGLGVTLLFSLP